jgi:VWFA-related protein
VSLRKLTLIAVLLLCAGALVAGTAQGPLFRSRLDLVALSLTVVDEGGRIVTGLTREAFTVTEDGRTRSIAHFTSDPVPVSLVIALDASGSMVGRRFSVASQAVMRFYDRMGPDDEISIIGFNDRPFVIAPWTRSSLVVRDALRRVTADGTTALYAAVLSAIDALRNAEHRRQAVIVISDGNDFVQRDPQASVPGPQQALERRMRALQRIEGTEAVVYAIGVDAPAADASIRYQEFDANALRRLTDPTGGITKIVKSDDAVVGAAEQIGEELRQQYQIGFVPANDSDGKFHRVRVTVSGCKCNVRVRAGFIAGGRP